MFDERTKPGDIHLKAHTLQKPIRGAHDNALNCIISIRRISVQAKPGSRAGIVFL